MRVIYDKFTLEIITVIEDDNSITAFPSNLSVIQGDVDMIATTAIALGLDLTQIPNLNMTAERIKVLNRLKRCKDVKIRFLEENASVTIENSTTQLEVFMNVLMLLDVGDAKTALAIVNQIPESSFILTPQYLTLTERKQSYIDELQQIITDLFES